MSGWIDTNEREHSWGTAARAFMHPKVIALLFLGFSAGVPILLIFSTLSVWLREADVARSTITFFSWAALGYGFKFVWAPLIDKLPVPVLTAALGRRRSWLLVAQIAIMVAMAVMALSDPTQSLTAVAVGAVMLGFSSATQDIVIDAYRIEAASPELQGMMSAAYVAGYRIGMVVAGAGALELAGILDVIDGYDYAAWRTTYFAMAGVMVIGVITTFMISEPENKSESAHLETASDYARFLGLFIIAAGVFIAAFWLSADIIKAAKTAMVEGGMIKQLAGFMVEAARLVGAGVAAFIAANVLIKTNVVPREMVRVTYIAPFADFFDRYGKVALLILALVATYRISDIVMGTVANVFYVDLGFEKQEIGRISKFFGLMMTIGGGFLGGLVMVRYGVMKTLFVGGVLSAATNVLFAVMAEIGQADTQMLMMVISADNISAGIAMTAFIAYLSGLTSSGFTAMQYAIFSSMMLLFPKIIAGYSGTVVEAVNYSPFFIGTAIIGVVPLALIVMVAKKTAKTG